MARDDTRYFDDEGHLWPYEIRFDPALRRHVWVEDGLAHFRVTTEPGFDEVVLVVRRPDESVEGVEFHQWAADTAHDHWAVTTDGSAGFAFTLALRRADDVVYVTNAGIAGAVERLDRWTFDPAAAALDVPDWAKGAVIYQIFPERFADGDPELTPEPRAPWGTPPDNYVYQGGDLIGVRKRLDHLVSLGVDCIYLNPIFPAPSTHKYDAYDFRRVDPGFGGDDALAALVEAAHAKSIRVILDASFNHVHPSFFAFDDIKQNGADSAYAEWFVVHDHPVRIKYRPHIDVTERYRWYLERLETLTGLPVVTVDDAGPPAEPTYDAWYGVPTMPRVDLQHPAARRYFLDTARHWLESFDIDGFRMDVTRYVDADFWDDFRRVCKEAKPDAYLLCEIFGDASPWLEGGRFDATMNYVFRQLAVDFFARRQVDAPLLAGGIARMLAMYPGPTSHVNQNLLGSHDVARFLTEAGDDEKALRLATVLQFTLPGAPGLYYGDEVGMTGGEDPGQRGAFPWDDPASWLGTQLRTVQELSSLRRSTPALRAGDWRLVTASGRLIAYARHLDGETIITIINDDDERAVVDHQATTVLWGDATIRTDAVEVPARSAAIVA